MRTYLVVAHKTLVGSALVEHVEALGMPADCHLHVVVPEEHPSDHAWTEGEVRAAARARLEEGLARFRAIGFYATGEVGDANPVYAATTALRNLDPPPEEVVVSTLPSGISRWLHWDVVSRLRRELDIPVTHVEAVTADQPG